MDNNNNHKNTGSDCQPVLARVETRGARSIQIVQPANGKQKIIDFGRDLDNITFTVYADDSFNAERNSSIYSSEYAGNFKIESIQESSYPGSGYNVFTVSALGDEQQDEEIQDSASIVKIRGLDNFYSVRYTTTYLENIGTGFSMSVSAKNKVSSGVVNFTYNSESASLGDPNAKETGYGKNISRLRRSYTTIFSDPLNIALQKTILISPVSEGSNATANILGEHVIYMSKNDFIDFIANTINKGDIKSFYQRLISGVDIDFSKIENSPIISAIAKSVSSGNGANEAGSYITNMFYGEIVDSWLEGGVFSVGSMLAQTLPLFGVEIYYNGNGRYSMEPPRFLCLGGMQKANTKIDMEHIISIDAEHPKTNIPSVVLPSVSFKNMALRGLGDKISAECVKEMMSAFASLNLPVLKIETFEIPNIVVPEAVIEQSIYGRIATYYNKIIAYYAGLAFKSVLSRMSIGTINVVFNPMIQEAHKWYEIIDENGNSTFYYVTEISHFISRGNAVTTLRYAGIYDEEMFKKIKQVSFNIAHIPEQEIDNLRNKLSRIGVNTPLTKENRE